MIQPDFYQEFKCIAGECSITCCQEWRITEDDGSDICLNADMKCPYLTEDRLCRKVLESGDRVLSETCSLFPRQIHEFSDRTEQSLVTCCPEVVDFLNRIEDFRLQGEESKDNLFLLREFLMQLLADESYELELALKMGFYLLLDVKQEGSFQLENYTREALQELKEAISGIHNEWMDTFMECNETFLDVASNYREKGIYKSFLTSLSEAAEDIETDYEEGELEECYEGFLKTIKGHLPLLRKCVISNIFSDLLLPESDINNMVVAFQWLGMEYAVLRQVLFLEYRRNGVLSYEQVREAIVYISRMMGYDEEDIVEYLLNCFENLEWEWGYFALLIG